MQCIFRHLGQRHLHVVLVGHDPVVGHPGVHGVGIGRLVDVFVLNVLVNFVVGCRGGGGGRRLVDDVRPGADGVEEGELGEASRNCGQQSVNTGVTARVDLTPLLFIPLSRFLFIVI